ncbi:MAG: pilus assembly protein N-terminal domain-containing protein, partial [Pseudomonadota bacterium]
ETTLIITGKSFGVTNMIVLDHDGEAIAESLLTVRGERVNAVTIYRRTSRITYSCSPKCERSLALGDEQNAFGAVQSQIQSRNAFASGSGGQGVE